MPSELKIPDKPDQPCTQAEANAYFDKVLGAILQNRGNLDAIRAILLTVAGLTIAKAAKAPSTPKDYRGRDNLPLGIRNNNPGNLIGGGQWQGLVGNTGGGYNVFENWIYGIRAAIITLNSYRNNHGLTTLEQITNRWAPYGHGGNDPAAYARYLSTVTGYAVDEPLPWNQDTIFRLLRGITGQENGTIYQSWITRRDFNEAYNLI